MSTFVLDNSITMRWCFEGASTPYSEDILERLLAGDGAHVPILWLYEVISVLAKAQRTDSISPKRALGFLQDLQSLGIVVDEASHSRIWTEVLSYCRRTQNQQRKTI